MPASPPTAPPKKENDRRVLSEIRLAPRIAFRLSEKYKMKLTTLIAAYAARTIYTACIPLFYNFSPSPSTVCAPVLL